MPYYELGSYILPGLSLQSVRSLVYFLAHKSVWHYLSVSSFVLSQSENIIDSSQKMKHLVI